MTCQPRPRASRGCREPPGLPSASARPVGVPCYNCHFQTEIDENRKLAYAKFRDWLFLGNFRGQVYPMNFQSVEYQDNTFIAYGPFFDVVGSQFVKLCIAPDTICPCGTAR